MHSQSAKCPVARTSRLSHSSLCNDDKLEGIPTTIAFPGRYADSHAEARSVTSCERNCDSAQLQLFLPPRRTLVVLLSFLMMRILDIAVQLRRSSVAWLEHQSSANDCLCSLRVRLSQGHIRWRGKWLEIWDTLLPQLQLWDYLRRYLLWLRELH